MAHPTVSAMQFEHKFYTQNQTHYRLLKMMALLPKKRSSQEESTQENLWREISFGLFKLEVLVQDSWRKRRA